MMLLTIEIVRDPYTRFLNAYVRQGGKRGINLLPGRQITKVSSAREQSERHLRIVFGAPMEVQFAGEEPERTHP